MKPRWRSSSRRSSIADGAGARAARDPGARPAGTGGGAADRGVVGAAAEWALADQLDPAVVPPERLGEVLTSWPEAQLSPSGEITGPAGRPGTEIEEVLRLLGELAA